MSARTPYLGVGTEEALSGTPSFFRGWNIDFGASSLLPTLLLIAGALSLSGSPRPHAPKVVARVAAGLAPAVIAAPTRLADSKPTPTISYLYRYPDPQPIVQLGPPYPLPSLPPSSELTLILGAALALVSVAFPLTWELTRMDGLHVPWWLLNLPYPLLLTTLPLLLALVLMRRAAGGATARSPRATPG